MIQLQDTVDAVKVWVGHSVTAVFLATLAFHIKGVKVSNTGILIFVCNIYGGTFGSFEYLSF